MKKKLLKEYFGYDQFREGQEDIIDNLLDGKDVLAIMPTGMGKSLCYQLPSLILDGITLVVSPLISLMNDQVMKLNMKQIPSAYINSSLSREQRSLAFENASKYKYKIVYVSPERLRTEEFLAFARSVKISLIAVDEAHCISQWGNDFRPSYKNIDAFIKSLPQRPVVGAFTATATKQVREDIIHSLDLSEPEIYILGFDRPNLSFEVKHTGERKYFYIKRILSSHKNECGIIYCNTIKNVERIYSSLLKDKIDACKYHADLGKEERSLSQTDFIMGKRKIIVATNAFGMGIDKPDIRFIVHVGMPMSLENYFQEAGRAGRDGKPSECVLLFNREDVEVAQMLIDLNLEKTPNDIKSQTMENNYAKLRAIHNYCLTSECLRNYILNYFGDQHETRCNHCSNCLTDFKEINVTDIAKSIIGCVKESGERFGVSTIHSILSGEDVPRLQRYHLPENSYFGRLKGIDYSLVKDTVNELLVRDYLIRPSGAYITIRTTTNSAELLAGNAKITIKKPM